MCQYMWMFVLRYFFFFFLLYLFARWVAVIFNRVCMYFMSDLRSLVVAWAPTCVSGIWVVLPFRFSIFVWGIQVVVICSHSTWNLEQEKGRRKYGGNTVFLFLPPSTSKCLCFCPEIAAYKKRPWGIVYSESGHCSPTYGTLANIWQM